MKTLAMLVPTCIALALIAVLLATPVLAAVALVYCSPLWCAVAAMGGVLAADVLDTAGELVMDGDEA